MSKAACLRLLKTYLEMGEISKETYTNAKKWLTNPEYEAYRDEVMSLIRPTALSNSFYQLIPFGTGGRRGLVGVGTNRINERTIGESAQGLANHILKVDKDGSLAKRGVAIGYDVRPTSYQFSVLVAEVMAANGICVYLYEGPRPTPMLSFAIRHLKCVAGAILTASHNPPTDNGFKAYWEDGGQLVPPNDKLVLQQVKKVKSIKRLDLEKAKAKKLVTIIGKKVDNAYFRKLKTLELTKPRNATIVFSPLHGTGVQAIPRGLADMGFTKVHMPAEQVEMNGYFPTVEKNYPNPEQPAAMRQAVQLGSEVKADIVMASDPDADRLGVFVPDKKGKFVYLTGNQVGAMMSHFICQSLTRTKKMPPKPYMLTTLVSTKMARAIAGDFGVEIIDDLLVGFKWMGELLHHRETKGENLNNFIFGFEESIGFMRGYWVRDKDAASGAVTAAQMTAWCKSKKMTLLEYLDSLYEKYGYFREKQFSVFLTGKAGSEKMAKIMDTFRNAPPKKIGTRKVHAVIDRLAGRRTDLKTGDQSDIQGTKGNVLVFELDEEGYTSVTVRPSGTEPKIKHYMAAYQAPGKSLGATKKKVDSLIEQLEKGTRKQEEGILNSM